MSPINFIKMSLVVVYNTRKVEGHRKNPIKREQKRIQNQKELGKLFRERDERLKARAKRS